MVESVVSLDVLNLLTWTIFLSGWYSRRQTRLIPFGRASRVSITSHSWGQEPKSIFPILASLVSGALHSTSAHLAKVSTSSESENQQQHLICVYIPDVYDIPALSQVHYLWSKIVFHWTLSLSVGYEDTSAESRRQSQWCEIGPLYIDWWVMTTELWQKVWISHLSVQGWIANTLAVFLQR